MLAEVEANVHKWTDEQLDAIERRDGDLLLAAGAGSGKTSVLVERFVRAVLEDGVDVGAMLTITFTEKAAAELRERIRARLRELGADEAARATEGAFISTIHGFCARVLRANALAAGIDPLFVILDDVEATRLAGTAFESALEELAQRTPGGVELIASYGAGALRGAIRDVYAELRSRGEREPALAPLGPAPSLGQARAELKQAAAAASVELGALADPGVRVLQALDRLERCAELSAQDDVWPGELDRIALPGGNGAALSTPVCLEYTRALAAVRRGCEHRHVERTHALLAELLVGFGRRYGELKRSVSGLDFEDLELMTRDLLAEHDELRERYAGRFERIMVDELQDTNGVQLALIESIAGGRDSNLFTVGDAQQSIYGFRHADVELFERLGERLAARGARATLQTNFRSRSEIIEVLNAAFANELGDQFMPLVAGRSEPSAEEPPAEERLVELLIADKAADWEVEGLAAPWRRAEARALAERVRELIDAGAAPRDIVVLTRATTDLRAYERALEDCGIPTYLIGGRGYWSHPQIVDMVAYLRALANPRDEEALYTLLASPLVGLSLGGLVLLAAAARSAAHDPWWVARESQDLLNELSGDDRERLSAFADWFEAERTARARLGIEQLIERVLVLTGYDLGILALAGGQRRLANVRKLMRLGREFESAHGPDLPGFLELVRGRAGGWAGDPRESEAPVEGEALDAVRLMTIHRAKGLEFEIVCVADLGRAPWRRAELMRIGRDGRFGLRLSEPGTAKAVPALDYKELGDERASAEGREERRVFYVAMTRARERLILSGAARLEEWRETASPMAWIGPAVVPEISTLATEASAGALDGVAWRIVRPGDAQEPPSAAPAASAPHSVSSPAPVGEPPVATERGGPAVSALSYSSLGEYQRCGYRFYAERVLGLPALEERTAGTGTPGVDLTGAERGIVLHALLEALDFRRPARPAATTVIAIARRAGVLGEVDVGELADLVEQFARSEVCARLARADAVRREERFSFLLPSGVRITGALDVLAREGSRRSLVVDYKSDRLQDAAPEEVVASEYATQRLIYAIAALRAGATEVDIVHLFLEQPGRPVSASFTVADLAELEDRLGRLADGVLRREFRVTEAPQRSVCRGCPAEGGLCSWPLELTRRETPDRLF